MVKDLLISKIALARSTAVSLLLISMVTPTAFAHPRLNGVTKITPSSTVGPTIVARQKIHQDWGVGAWSSHSIQLTDVQAGDAIIVLGLYWNSTGGALTPTDDVGTLRAAVDQSPVYVQVPAVGAQIFYELNAAPGIHTITPPGLGGGDGDGTFYVLQVRGLSPSASLVAIGQSHKEGTALQSATVQLSSNAMVGDFVVAVGGEDDEVGTANAQVTDPPSGWQSIGVDNDANVNVPSEACFRPAPSIGNQSVKWTWKGDPTANVTTAAIAAFR
ncbi:MAG: hypothetical protein JSR66_08595 [Proteobacteria bacterium]|nr:hypothetical protein [Pseudomonadota bacterium]